MTVHDFAMWIDQDALRLAAAAIHADSKDRVHQKGHTGRKDSCKKPKCLRTVAGRASNQRTAQPTGVFFCEFAIVVDGSGEILTAQNGRDVAMVFQPIDDLQKK